MRGWGRPVLASAIVAAACGFLAAILVSRGLAEASMWAGALGAVAAVVAAVWPLAASRSRALPPPQVEVPGWVVGRPAEVSAVAAALTGGRRHMVGITTALEGAGGFGKTTLALMACADRRVRRRFGKQVYLVTVGRDVRDLAAVAAKVNDLICLVSGRSAAFTDPELAGQRLGSLLDAGPRRLLVLDDVWDPAQLAPFVMGGRRCTRLVTTRVTGLVEGPAVVVDQMPPEQASAVLLAGGVLLDDPLTAGLLAVTGRWPLLLHLVNKILKSATESGADVNAAAGLLLQRLRASGPSAVDELSGRAGYGLEVGQEQARARAVRATIEASTSLLDSQEAQRLAELAVFAEDEVIPFQLAARLWRATAGLDELQVSHLSARLRGLGLVSRPDAATSGLVMHDVIRDYLRAGLGPQRIAELNGRLLDSVAATLPRAGCLSGEPTPAWWQLGGEEYLGNHLIRHLADASRHAEAEAVAGELRWIAARLQAAGPAAPSADLAQVGTQLAARLRAVLDQAAHLLTPTEPPEALTDIMHSRVATDPYWAPQVTALQAARSGRCRLAARWPLPDLPDPALRRAFTGHGGGLTAAAIAPDGTWLATGGQDGTVRTWDMATGRERTVLARHRRRVTALAIAPDGTWLASGCSDGKTRIWDTGTGRRRAILAGPRYGAGSISIAPDGTWLATGGGAEGRVRIWDTAGWQKRVALGGPGGRVRAVAIAPDGTWLVTSWEEEGGAMEGIVRIWDTATWHERATLSSHSRWVSAVAIAPDGTWLACGGNDGTARIWDTASWRERLAISGHRGWVTALAAAPDGTWLATADSDAVRIRDPATGEERTAFVGPGSKVSAITVAPDGTWLATCEDDGAIRIWDTKARGTKRGVGSGHDSLAGAIAAAQDGTWLATGGGGGTVRIWDTATGQERGIFASHGNYVSALAIAADGTWLATYGDDGAVRIWDTATSRERVSVPGYGIGGTLAIAPDGTWLVTAGSPDGPARIWDAATGRQRTALTGGRGYVCAVAIAPDGTWVAVGTVDGKVRIYDTIGRERRTLPSRRGSPVSALAIAADGTWLATGADNGEMRIWDPATGRQRAALPSHHGSVTAMAMTPNGSWLATGSSGDGTVRIWDTTTWQAAAMMRVDSKIRGLAWAGDGALAIAGSAGLYLFDVLDTAADKWMKQLVSDQLSAVPYDAKG